MKIGDRVKHTRLGIEGLVCGISPVPGCWWVWFDKIISPVWVHESGLSHVSPEYMEMFL